METTWQDLRFAVRGLARRPGLTLLAVLCLALGIGANSATFSFTNALFFHRLPVPRNHELIRIYNHYREGMAYGPVSIPFYQDFRDQTRTLRGLVAETYLPVTLRTTRRASASGGPPSAPTTSRCWARGRASAAASSPRRSRSPGPIPWWC